ncbi:hypothetical protein Pse7429DRAFT_2455 [Pseudanabaena biceps PCC 7429]|uniref:KTSC domain-containing protein n=3 Tax=Pseudanabaena TaxID=1152 RepID=L8N2E9_9CYAN|nr:hypothetical protein Pse7429DRAFT_2455 [Pseudanabaena biceps PCC 7429]
MILNIKEDRTMQMIDVDSSMLSSVGYDSATQTLRTVFNSGKTYDYFKVSQEVYDELIASESKGRYMRDEIIDMYSYQQVKRKSKY